MKAMKVRLTKELLLTWMRLPAPLILRSVSEDSQDPTNIEMVIEGEELPEEFEIGEGETIPFAMISHKVQYDDVMKSRTIELESIKKCLT